MYNSVQELRTEFDIRRLELDFLDSNAWVGHQVEPAYKRIHTVDELIGKMDSSHTSEALVTHTSAFYYDAIEGNELTLRAVADHDRLYAAVVLLPESTGEIEDAAEYLDQAITRKARAVRLFPITHTFNLKPWLIGSVLETMQERRLPLILWHSETSWDEVHSLCERYPELPIVIEGTGRKLLYDNRIFCQLLSMHQNLYIEMHNLANCRFVEYLVDRVGAESLIYGSYLPYQEPAITMMSVTHSAISDDDKRLIAGGNMRRLIAGVRGRGGE